VRKLLLAERRVFRDAVCAGNEGALKRVRDKSENGMAVRTLENLAEETTHNPRGSVTMPGLIIQVINAPAVPREPITTIDVKPEAPLPPEPRKPSTARNSRWASAYSNTRSTVIE
jgi:hypothetical protein